MDRNSFTAHEGLKEGRRSAEYLLARERFAQEQDRASRVHRAKVALFKVLLAANAVIWTAQHLRGAL